MWLSTSLAIDTALAHHARGMAPAGDDIVRRGNESLREKLLTVKHKNIRAIAALHAPQYHHIITTVPP